MIAELGHFALILALLTAAMQSVLPLVGAARDDERWMAVARPAARMQCALVLLAYGALTWAFVSNDFSVLYVAANSNSALPLPYRVAAVWGGHEGSMLLWTTMLALWSLAVSLFSRQLPLPVVARVLGVMGAISTGLLLFLLFASNPFLRLLPPAMEGRDLNPLLQDPGMVSHPPMLYMGYVGFAVAFSFAMAALLSGRLDATWARWSRPWTTAAWACLTTGIMLGSAWAYYELGWGGWWFWDPVENASFMPWLAGTALIHSLAVTEKRGVFRAWTALLAIFTFSLSLLGTFLVRSGVLTSVHAFAVDPKRGLFILALLGIVTGGALGLFAWRAKRLSSNASEGATFPLFARESFLLANNVLLAVAAATVLLGTLYPLLLDVLRLGKISVGPAYFEQVFVPLMSPAVLLMGAAPLARWRHGALPSMAVRLRWAAVASVAARTGGDVSDVRAGGPGADARRMVSSECAGQSGRKASPARQSIDDAAAIAAELLWHASGARGGRRVHCGRHAGAQPGDATRVAGARGRQGGGGRLHVPPHQRCAGPGPQLRRLARPR